MSNNRLTYKHFIAIALFIVVLGSTFWFQAQKETQAEDQYYKPGLALYDKGDYTDAESDFRAFLSHYSNEPFCAPTYYALGMCLLHEGRRDEAQEAFQNAIDYAACGSGRDSCAPNIVSAESKAQAALNWMRQNPNCQPPASGQTPNSPAGAI